MTKTEQLERDAERIRADLAETLIEFRACLTPARAVDQLFDIGSDSSALGLLRKLRDKTVTNPLAVGIVSAGMAWLMFSKGKEASRQYGAPDQAQRRAFSDKTAKNDVAEDREELNHIAQEQDEKSNLRASTTNGARTR